MGDLWVSAGGARYRKGESEAKREIVGQKFAGEFLR